MGPKRISLSNLTAAEGGGHFAAAALRARARQGSTDPPDASALFFKYLLVPFLRFSY